MESGGQLSDGHEIPAADRPATDTPEARSASTGRQELHLRTVSGPAGPARAGDEDERADLGARVAAAHAAYQHALRRQAQWAAYARAFRARLDANAVLRRILAGHRQAMHDLAVPPLPAGWQLDPEDPTAVGLQVALTEHVSRAWTRWHARLSVDFGVLLTPAADLRCGDQQRSDRVIRVVEEGFRKIGSQQWLARRSARYRQWRAATVRRVYTEVAGELQTRLAESAASQYHRVLATLDDGDRALGRRLRAAQRRMAAAATAVDTSHAGWLATVRERDRLLDPARTEPMG
jgi:hypothetical protein